MTLNYGVPVKQRQKPKSYEHIQLVKQRKKPKSLEQTQLVSDSSQRCYKSIHILKCKRNVTPSNIA